MMKTYDVIGYANRMNREDWLQLRQGYIGGSDAGAVLGVNPWHSALDVYFDKTGEVKAKPATYKMRLGNALEQTVSNFFEEETGLKVRKNHAMMVSREHPFMLADIDREIIGENAILECKTTSGWNKDQWANDMVPISYQVQVQHYMAVTGAEKAYVACMIGFDDFVIREISRDEETIALIVEGEQEFMDLLTNPEAPLPPPDGSQAYTQALNQRYATAMENEIPVEIPFSLDYYFQLCDQMKRLQEKKEQVEQHVKQEMKDATYAKTEAGDVIRWKEIVSSRLDSKAFKKDYPELYQAYTKEKSYRRFQITPRKEEEEEA